MAKKITGSVKLQIAAGKATPAPPVGPALGQAQINIMEFCKQFNARTNAKELEGLIIPVVVSVYSDRGGGRIHRFRQGRGEVGAGIDERSDRGPLLACSQA